MAEYLGGPPVNIGTGVFELRTDSSKLTSGLNEAHGQVKNSLAGITKLMVGAAAIGGGALAAGFGKYLDTAIKQQSAFAETWTLLGKTSREEFGKIEKDAKNLAARLNVNWKDMSKGLYDSISAGVPQDNVIAFLEKASKGAAAGVASLGQSVDATTSVVNAFRAMGLEAGRAIDVMFATIEKGKTTLPELAKSIYNVAPVAASLGIDIETVAAGLATLTASGTPTRVATTGLRVAFNELSQSTYKAGKALQEMTGKSLRTLMKEGKNAGELIRQLYETRTEDQFYALFGMEAQTAVANMMTNWEYFSGALDRARDSAGAADAAFEKMSSTLTFQMGVAMKTLNQTFINVAATAIPLVEQMFDEKILPAVMKFAKWFEDNEDFIKDWFESVWKVAYPVISDFTTGFIEIGKVAFKFITFITGNKALFVASITAMGWAMTVAFGPTAPMIIGVGMLITLFGNLKAKWNEIVAANPAGTWMEHGVKLIEAVAEGIRNGAEAVRDALIESFNSIRELLPFSDAKEGPLSDLTARGMAIITTLSTGVRDGAPYLVDAISDALDDATQAVATFEFWYDVGANIVHTMSRGISDAAVSVYNALVAVFNNLVNLLPFSDAKEGPLSNLTRSGQNIILTLANGVRVASSELSDEAAGALQNLESALSEQGWMPTPEETKQAIEDRVVFTSIIKRGEGLIKSIEWPVPMQNLLDGGAAGAAGAGLSNYSPTQYGNAIGKAVNDQLKGKKGKKDELGGGAIPTPEEAAESAKEAMEAIKNQFGAELPDEIQQLGSRIAEALAPTEEQLESAFTNVLAWIGKNIARAIIWLPIISWRAAVTAFGMVKTWVETVIDTATLWLPHLTLDNIKTAFTLIPGWILDNVAKVGNWLPTKEEAETHGKSVFQGVIDFIRTEVFAAGTWGPDWLQDMFSQPTGAEFDAGPNAAATQQPQERMWDRFRPPDWMLNEDGSIRTAIEIGAFFTWKMRVELSELIPDWMKNETGQLLDSKEIAWVIAWKLQTDWKTFATKNIPDWILDEEGKFSFPSFPETITLPVVGEITWPTLPGWLSDEEGNFAFPSLSGTVTVPVIGEITWPTLPPWLSDDEGKFSFPSFPETITIPVVGEITWPALPYWLKNEEGNFTFPSFPGAITLPVVGEITWPTLPPWLSDDDGNFTFPSFPETITVPVIGEITWPTLPAWLSDDESNFTFPSFPGTVTLPVVGEITWPTLPDWLQDEKGKFAFPEITWPDWSAQGTALLGTLASGVQDGTGKITLSGALSSVFKWVVDTIFPSSDAKEGPFSNLTTHGKSIVTTLADGMKDAGTTIRDTLKTAFEAVGWTDLFVDSILMGIDLVTAISLWMQRLGIVGVGLGALTLNPALVGFSAASFLIGIITEFITFLIRPAVDEGLRNALNEIDFGAHGKAIIDGISTGIKNVKLTLSAAFLHVFNFIKDNLFPSSDAKEGPFSNLTTTGSAIIKTLVSGIELVRQELVDAMTDVFNDAVAIWETLPSRINSILFGSGESVISVGGVEQILPGEAGAVGNFVEFWTKVGNQLKTDWDTYLETSWPAKRDLIQAAIWSSLTGYAGTDEQPEGATFSEFWKTLGIALKTDWDTYLETDWPTQRDWIQTSLWSAIGLVFNLDDQPIAGSFGKFWKTIGTELKAGFDDWIANDWPAIRDQIYDSFVTALMGALGLIGLSSTEAQQGVEESIVPTGQLVGGAMAFSQAEKITGGKRIFDAYPYLWRTKEGDTRERAPAGLIPRMPLARVLRGASATMMAGAGWNLIETWIPKITGKDLETHWGEIKPWIRDNIANEWLGDDVKVSLTNLANFLTAAGMEGGLFEGIAADLKEIVGHVETLYGLEVEEGSVADIIGAKGAGPGITSVVLQSLFRGVEITGDWAIEDMDSIAMTGMILAAIPWARKVVFSRGVITVVLPIVMQGFIDRFIIGDAAPDITSEVPEEMARQMGEQQAAGPLNRWAPYMSTALDAFLWGNLGWSLGGGAIFKKLISPKLTPILASIGFRLKYYFLTWGISLKGSVATALGRVLPAGWLFSSIRTVLAAGLTGLATVGAGIWAGTQTDRAMKREKEKRALELAQNLGVSTDDLPEGWDKTTFWGPTVDKFFEDRDKAGQEFLDKQREGIMPDVAQLPMSQSYADIEGMMEGESLAVPALTWQDHPLAKIFMTILDIGAVIDGVSEWITTSWESFKQSVTDSVSDNWGDMGRYMQQSVIDPINRQWDKVVEGWNRLRGRFISFWIGLVSNIRTDWIKIKAYFRGEYDPFREVSADQMVNDMLYGPGGTPPDISVDQVHLPDIEQPEAFDYEGTDIGPDAQENSLTKFIRDSFITPITNAFTGAQKDWEELVTKWNDFWSGLNEKIVTHPIVQAIGRIFPEDRIMPDWEEMREQFGADADSMINKATELGIGFDDSIIGFLSGSIQTGVGIVSWLSGTLEDMKQAVTDWLPDFSGAFSPTEGWKEKIELIFNPTIEGTKTILGDLQTQWSEFASAVEGFIQPVKDLWNSILGIIARGKEALKEKIKVPTPRPDITYGHTPPARQSTRGVPPSGTYPGGYGVHGNYMGGIALTPQISTLAERGPEVVLNMSKLETIGEVMGRAQTKTVDQILARAGSMTSAVRPSYANAQGGDGGGGRAGIHIEIHGDNYGMDELNDRIVEGIVDASRDGKIDQRIFR